MIVTETREINGKKYIYNYSNEGYYIRKIGTDEVYSDACDLPEKGYVYEETDKKIESEE